jgi:hypothetical protein
MPELKKKETVVRWITKKHMRSIVDRRARAVLNISVSTFMKNRRNGKYANLDADECPGIVELALLAPGVRSKASASKNR